MTNNKGWSLVELIVTFALTAIFITCTTLLLSTTVKTYNELKMANLEQQVCDTILDKIEGEIEGAIERASVEGSIIIHQNTSIELENRTGSQIVIGKEDSILNITYKEIKSDSGNLIYEQVDWKFDEKMYMGFHLEDLTFEKPVGNYPGNIIKVTIQLNDDTSTYPLTGIRYVECYNFDNGNSNQIVYKGD